MGGSATNDLGLGALAALGLEFRGAEGGKIRPPVPAQWERIARLDGGVFPSIPPIFIACDVTNPLSARRAPRRSTVRKRDCDPQDLPRMEAPMERMARLLCAYCGQPVTSDGTPGRGRQAACPSVCWRVPGPD